MGPEGMQSALGGQRCSVMLGKAQLLDQAQQPDQVVSILIRLSAFLSDCQHSYQVVGILTRLAPVPDKGKYGATLVS